MQNEEREIEMLHEDEITSNQITGLGFELKLYVSLKTLSPLFLSFPVVFIQATLSLLFAQFLYLGREAESHQYPLHSSCSVALHYFLSQLSCSSLLSVNLPFLSVHVIHPFPPFIASSSSKFPFPCTGVVQSHHSGYWCFSTVGELPPLLKKIESHKPDESRKINPSMRRIKPLCGK